MNHKRTWRLYCDEGLSIRPKVPRRKRAWRYRVGRPGPTAPNEVWSMDFVSGQLFDGRPIRILAVIDAHTREALSIVPRASFRTFDVVQELDGLARGRGRPKTLKVDNGPEFAGRLLDQWAHLNGVELDFSRPGKPTDNAHIEAFNSRLRAECLNASWFLSLADARDRLEGWRREYNGRRMRRPAAWVTAELDPAGVRRAGSTSPKSCVAPGPEQRAGPARHHLLERAAQLGGHLCWILDPVSVLQQCTERCKLVGQFVQLPAQTADHRGRHLPG